ncbi:prepilin-type N-terminal cleavage/methylation domain-containing protein [Neptuniibacter sp. QD37_11]|uniref:prepilin-type N-terminal cleavage/methylation domain-containing protein n=1 Tax=Neptuniibacter sp. QD37_11 TaxID=3398209 RepID=UPI0039F63C0B
MKHYNKGFSLLETMLVLAIAAAAVMLASHYQTHEIRQTQARQVGQQIYQYHNAIKAYTMSGVVDFATLPTGTFVGVNWLKSTSCGGTASREFLPCDYPDTLTFGQLSFSSTVTKGVNSDGDPVIDITTITSPFITNDGIERSDLAGLAAIAAAGYSSIFAPISSTFGNVTSDPKTAVISMTAYNAPGGDDIWLRTNGTNDMKGSINFSGTDPEDNNLTGVNRIAAEDGGTLTLGDAGTLTGDLVVEYDSEILGQLYVQDDLNVDGMADVTGNVRSRSNVLADNNMIAGGDVAAGNDVRASGEVRAGTNVLAGQNVTAARDLSAGGDLSVADDATIRGDTSVLGKATISGDAVVHSRLSAMQDLTVARNSYFSGNATVSGYTDLQGGFRSRGDSHVDGYLYLGRTVSEGSGCSQRGALAKLSNGAAVSCASGKWEKINGQAPPPQASHCKAQTLKYYKFKRSVNSSTYRYSSYHTLSGSFSVAITPIGGTRTKSYTQRNWSQCSYNYTITTTYTCMAHGKFGAPSKSYSRSPTACDPG